MDVCWRQFSLQQREQHMCIMRSSRPWRVSVVVPLGSVGIMDGLLLYVIIDFSRAQKNTMILVRAAVQVRATTTP